MRHPWSYWGILNKSSREWKSNSLTIMSLFLNPFHGTGRFLYTLKRSEILWFSDVFRGYRKTPVPWNWLRHQAYQTPRIKNFELFLLYNTSSFRPVEHYRRILKIKTISRLYADVTWSILFHKKSRYIQRWSLPMI